MTLSEPSTQTAVALADQPIIVDELVDGGYRPAQLLSTMRVSRTNRKRFNQRKLDELTENIKKQGVLQPILIRPVIPTAEFPQPFEIVAGERRFLCSLAAGLLTGPVIIRKLSDLEAALIQTFENLHREDLHPMEEAEGFQNLMLTHGYSAEKLAKEMDVTKAYVYASLKLCDLSLPLRDAFFEDKFPASIAILLARIPVPAIQLRAMNDVIGKEPDNEAMPVRQAAAHIKTHYTLKLVDAPFDIKDQKLTSAGSCEKCPKRTGNQPEIFADTAPNICTDPDCFAEKLSATHHKKIFEYERKGLTVYQGEEGIKLLGEILSRKTAVVSGETQLCYFSRLVRHEDESMTLHTALKESERPSPCGMIVNSKKEFQPIYHHIDAQHALEDAGVCLNLVEDYDKNHANKTKTIMAGEPEHEPETTIATPRTDTTLSGSASVIKSPDDKTLAETKAMTEIAVAETTFRTAVYIKLRQKGFAGFSLESLREFVKVVLLGDNGYTIPTDIIGELYPTDLSTDDAAITYIDQASLEEVQLILVDMVLGNSLFFETWRISAHDDFETVLKMARAEGIDPEQIRAELENPAEPEPKAEPQPDTAPKPAKRAKAAKPVPASTADEAKAEQATEVINNEVQAPVAAKQPAKRVRNQKTFEQKNAEATTSAESEAETATSVAKVAPWPFPKSQGI